MMRHFIRGAWYVRIRATLGVFYILMGTIIIARGCFPLNTFSLAKISPLILGAAFMGLGILRIRDLLLLQGRTSA
jgi:hypothetical protein